MCVHTCLLGEATIKASRLSELWSMSLPDDSPEGRTFQPKWSTCKTPLWMTTQGLACLQPRVASGMTAEAGHTGSAPRIKEAKYVFSAGQGPTSPCFPLENYHRHLL